MTTKKSAAKIRKRRFRAALGYRGMTQREFAAKYKVTAGHLSAVLSAKRESGRLVEQIDLFIAASLPTIPSA